MSESWRTLPELAFTSTYVTTNYTPPSAPSFSASHFSTWISTLTHPFLPPHLPAALLCAALVGSRRGDLCAPLLQHVLSTTPSESHAALVHAVREALTLVVPFAGLPHCIPALLGISGVLARSNHPAASRIRDSPIDGPAAKEAGVAVSTAVYAGVGNAAVAQMLGAYFPDAATLVGSVMFGWGMGGAAGEAGLGALALAECVLVAVIVGMGATRQGRSHVKAAIQLGVPVELVKALVEVVGEVVEWGGAGGVGEIDVASLEGEVRRNLEAGVKGEPFV
ncbi:hypothetical protein EDC01DRAFT_761290 [Geopyxis carbonaria]|nr:hypothetical protein EDC01DRAFT_761290 [Geopyxis carbonaria]